MNAKSHRLLNSVHSELALLMTSAERDSPVHFEITEGLRTQERQAQLLKAGASRTMNSRHLTGHAVDIVCLVDGEVRWDWPLYERVAEHIKRVAEQMDVDIIWGGDWRMRDGPHYELDRDRYPAPSPSPSNPSPAQPGAMKA